MSETTAANLKPGDRIQRASGRDDRVWVVDYVKSLLTGDIEIWVSLPHPDSGYGTWTYIPDARLNRLDAGK